MASNTMLTALKVDLGINRDTYDHRLLQYLNSAAEAIAAEGITLDDTSPLDRDLQVMYAAWLWRKRDTGDGMPRMIRWHLNNRLLSEKAKCNG